MLRKIEKAMKDTDPTYLAVGYLRYEALRKLNPRQFADLWSRSLKVGKFDELVDELITKGAQHVD